VLTIYGIPNCDTCRKARKWLDANSVEHRFHDLRVDGIDKEMLNRWLESAGWQKLLNTRSATWRGLTEADKQDLDETRAIDLMLLHPTLVKRPLADSGESVLIGFSEADYSSFKA